MKKAELVLKETLVTIECIILGIGVLLSYSGTAEAALCSNAYIPYYLYSVLGIAFIVVLVKLRKKQYTIYLGLLLIVLYLAFAGGHGYYTCAMAVRRFRNLNANKGAEGLIRLWFR